MNILFYLGKTFDPEQGGIHRVTDVLMRAMSASHNVYCLIQRKTSDNLLPSNFFYIPNLQEIYSDENKNFVSCLCKKLFIDIVINQEVISPKSSEFIIDVIPPHIKLISVVHSSLLLSFGARKRFPYRIKYYVPNVMLSVADNIFWYYFRMKYRRPFCLLLKRSDKIIVLESSLIQDVINFVGDVKPQQIQVIYNPISLPEASYIPQKEKLKNILFVGRLSREKGIDIMLQIWKGVEKTHPDWNLIIVGDGIEKYKILKLIHEFDLKHVSLMGKQNPIPYYQQASIFLMTSLFEGLPLVLLEAMNYSVIPMAFDSFSSIHAIIDDGKSGFILPAFDTQKYAVALSDLMDNEDLREQMAKMAYEKSKEFSVGRILEKWDSLFNSL